MRKQVLLRENVQNRAVSLILLHVLHDIFCGAIDATRQAIKEWFDQEQMLDNMNMNKCLIGAATKETIEHVKEKLGRIVDLTI